MKAIKIELQINRVSIKKDDSISFTAKTPELTDEELGVFRKISKVLVNAILEPQGGSTEILEIKEKIETGKSASSRLRSVLFVWWEQLGRPGDDFEVWYRMKMERIIDGVKGKLE